MFVIPACNTLVKFGYQDMRKKIRNTLEYEETLISKNR